MLEDRKLLPKDQILKGELSLIAQQRSERACHNPQPLGHHGPETKRAHQKKAIKSTRTNIQEGQPAFSPPKSAGSPCASPRSEG